jgi:hypothetical protein
MGSASCCFGEGDGEHVCSVLLWISCMTLSSVSNKSRGGDGRGGRRSSEAYAAEEETKVEDEDGVRSKEVESLFSSRRRSSKRLEWNIEEVDDGAGEAEEEEADEAVEKEFEVLLRGSDGTKGRGNELSIESGKDDENRSLRSDAIDDADEEVDEEVDVEEVCEEDVDEEVDTEDDDDEKHEGNGDEMAWEEVEYDASVSTGIKESRATSKSISSGFSGSKLSFSSR